MEDLVSTAGTLTFDPTTDVQVLREFDFDEIIQRPETIRFFTLAEQTTDYMEKILPKTPVIPKAVLRRAEHEVDSMRDLYLRILKATPEGYEQVPPARPESLSWVYPYSKEPVAYSAYPFTTTWTPLFAEEEGAITYMNILDSLPKHTFFPGSLQRYALDKKTTFFSKARNQFVEALPDVSYTKTAYREDGSYRIQTVKRPGTTDAASYDGWRIDPPPLDFPNPLEDNPFLNRRTDPVYMDTEEPLPSLLPSVDLIFEHAVPTTTNPYKEAGSFLKLWDVRYQDVPWSIWKTKFQPVDPISAPPELAELKPPTTPGEEAAPSQSLQDQYKTKFYPAQSSWLWLSKQLDGGNYLATLYLANVGSQEPIAIPPPLQDSSEGLLPSGTAEDCLPTHVDDFEDFAARGVFRPGTGQSLKEDEPGWKGKAVCLPLSFLQKEQEDAPYAKRKPWLPDTAANLLSTYRSKLAERVYEHEDLTKQTYARAKAPEPFNKTRAQILAIQVDEDRANEDKARDIRTLLDTLLTPEPKIRDFQYFDGNTNAFLICEHTLRQLEGEYAADPPAYRKKWGAEEIGSITCRYCGEPIETEVYVQQDQFDESGRLIGTTSALPIRSFVVIDHSTKTFVQSLADLAEQFNPKSPAEDLMFLILSLIQVIPDIDKLKPILDYVRREVDKIEALIVTKKLDAKKAGDARFLEAILGFNAIVVLLQIHDPVLVPRRSIGSKPLSLRGFPRDTSDINDAPLIDGLIFLLRKTFEDYPTTFKGSSVGFLRVLLENPAALKDKVLASMNKQVIPYFKTALVSAAESAKPEVRASTSVQNSFEPPMLRFDRTDFMEPAAQLKQGDVSNRSVCKSLIPGWTSATRIYSTFQETKIVKVIEPSLTAELVRKEDLPEADVGRVPAEAEIRRRIRLGLPKEFPYPTFRKIADLTDSVLLQTCLEMVLNTIGSVTKQNMDRFREEATTSLGDPSLLRDAFKGLLYEVAQSLDKPTLVNVERSLATNMALRTLLTSADSAKKMRDRLRATETENYKRQLRQMTDVKREVTKRLQDLHIGIQLITKEDREEFMREIAAAMEEQQVAAAEGEEVPDAELPEEGLNVERDVGEQGNDVVNQDGEQLEDDYGDYGDRRAKTGEGEELPDLATFDFEEGYGS